MDKAYEIIAAGPESMPEVCFQVIEWSYNKYGNLTQRIMFKTTDGGPSALLDCRHIIAALDRDNVPTFKGQCLDDIRQTIGIYNEAVPA